MAVPMCDVAATLGFCMRWQCALIVLAMIVARPVAAQPAGEAPARSADTPAGDAPARSTDTLAQPAGDDPARSADPPAQPAGDDPARSTDTPAGDAPARSTDTPAQPAAAFVAAPTDPAYVAEAAEPPRPPISRGRRAGAIAAAIFPGILVRGIGSYIVGEKRAAKRLLWTAAGGGVLAGIGGAFVGGTGGNPYVVWPEVPLLLVGAGGFLTSWFADIYVAAGGSDLDAHPRALPPYSVEASVSWQHDAYRERALAGAAARFELGRLGLGASGLVDTGGDAALGDLDVRVRILGAPATGEVITCGNRLVARVGARLYRDKADDTTELTGEVELLGRYDLANLDRALGPQFVDAWTGLGEVRTTYAKTSHDWGSELIGGFAWGSYIGTRGEARVFYEHRRDGIVGGIAAWRAAGFVGSVGGSVDLRVSGPWAVRAQLEIGNAWLTTLAVGYRGGPS